MRKHTVFLAALMLTISFAAQAQYSYKPFRIDVGIGPSVPVSGFGLGFLGGIEPKYDIDNFSIGARIEYHYANQRPEGDEDIHITKLNKALLLTGDYHFNNTATNRPFVGVGIGSFTLAGDYENYLNGDHQNITFDPTVGGMIRAGFDIPHLRVALQCNITKNEKVYNTRTDYHFSYISLVVSVGIGGGRTRINE